jgi:predicted transposase YdaD
MKTWRPRYWNSPEAGSRRHSVPEEGKEGGREEGRQEGKEEEEKSRCQGKIQSPREIMRRQESFP